MSCCPSRISEADFLTFVRGLGMNSTVLPDDSPSIHDAYCVAVALVNLQLAAAAYTLYRLAVYNLGADNLINYANDVQPPAAYVPPPPLKNPDGLSFFAFYRNLWKIYDFTPGVVQSTGDEGTNTSLVVQKAAENFTLDDLQHLKTPYGRRYLQIAQKVGTNWGLS